MARGVKGSVKTYGDLCPSCKATLTLENSMPRKGHARSGLYSHCRPCFNAKATARRKKDPDYHRQRNRDYRLRLRTEVLAAYGGKCACCGEATPEFLALDHVHGGGGKERREQAHNQSSGVYRMIKKLGFPKDKYQLLCHNCNCAKGWYGRCPHQNP